MRLMQIRVFKMMTLRDLINKLLEEKRLVHTARERLQLVLVLWQSWYEFLTTDLLIKWEKKFDVVAKYVEIDFEEVAVS